MRRGREDGEWVGVLGRCGICIEGGEKGKKLWGMVEELGMEEGGWEEVRRVEDVKEFVKKVGYGVLVGG